MEKPLFEIGEEVISEIDERRGVILEIVKRDDSFSKKYKYRVRWNSYKFLYPREEWTISFGLNKIIKK